MPVFNFDVKGLPEKRFDRDETLLEEGGYCGRVYVLKDGAMRVMHGNVVLARLTTPLTMVGEISVLTDARHSATVIAESFTVVYFIEDLIGLARQKPDVALYIAQFTAQRMVTMNQMVADMKASMDKPAHAKHAAPAANEATTDEAIEPSSLNKLLGRLSNRFRGNTM